MFLSPLLFQALLVYSFALFKFFKNSCPILVPNGLHFQPLMFLGMGEENSLCVFVAFLATHKSTVFEKIILAGNPHWTRSL